MQNSFITERLSIDLVTINDDGFILELVNSKGWLDYIGDRGIHSKEEAVSYIEKILNNQNFTYWVVRLKDNNIPIGIISFIKRSYLKHYDIGFAFLPNFEGHGYGFEAAKEVLLKVIQHPEHLYILATTVPQNINSIKLLKKLGLQFNEEIKVENEMLQVYSIKHENV
ncbi:MAG: GNAT family N-acetyltransferase [Ferruginibacter sp.]